MSLSRKAAQELCSAAELELFDQSTIHGVKSLSIQQIQSKLKLAQKYREKYSSLHKSQMREMKRKTGSGIDPLVAFRTARKVKIFEDCIQRFESALKKRIDQANRPKKPLGRPPGSKNKYKAPYLKEIPTKASSNKK